MSHVDILHSTVHAGGAHVKPWIRRLARAGLVARGLTYLMVGVLAARKAFGQGGRTMGTGDAVNEMGRGAFGDVLLGFIAAGLVGYGVWRCLQAIHDTEGKGHDGKGLAVRALYLGKGLVHFALAATPIKLLMDEPGGGGGGMKSWTAEALSQPAGQWLVGALGAAVIGAGLYQVFKGVKRKFEKNLDDGGMQPTARTWAYRAGTFGYVARGITFGVIGWFFVEAARQADPGEARGLGEALDVLLRQGHGPWLMGLVALGLASYGLYSFVEARYRRIRT